MTFPKSLWLATSVAAVLVMSPSSSAQNLSVRTPANASRGSAFDSKSQGRPPFIMPDTVGGFIRGESAPVSGSPHSRAYPYRDTSQTWITVFVRPRKGHGHSADDREAVAQEGQGFIQTLPAGIERGLWDDFAEVFSRADSVKVGGKWIDGHVTAVVTKNQGAVSVKVLYVYVLGEHFVKVRATIPAADWEASGVPDFAHQLVVKLAKQ